MDYKCILRALVCFLVVCCLIVNLSPLRVHASPVAVAALVGVAAGSVVASVLIGLGVMPAPDMTGFNDLVDRCVAALPSLGISVLDGCVNVVKILTGQKVDYTVTQDFVDTVRDWLFDACLSVAAFTPVHYDPDIQAAFDLAALHQYAAWFTDVDEHVYIIYSDSGPISIRSGADIGSSFVNSYFVANTPYVSSDLHCYTWSNSKGMYQWFVGSFGWDADQVLNYFGLTYTEVVSSADVVLGVVADPAVDVAAGYDVWTSGATTVPGSDIGRDEEDMIRVYPLHLGQTYEETIQATQQQVWEGESTYDDTASDVVAGDTWADWSVTRFFGRLTNIFSSLLTSLQEGLLSGIAAIFVPSEDILTAKVDALRAEFSWVDSLLPIIQGFVPLFSDMEPEPPVVYINLGDSRGSYDYGGKVAFIDMTWYAEYKPTVDALLSGVLWVIFVWRLWLKVPGIISGLPGDFVMDSITFVGWSDRLPARKSEYEAQRLAHRRMVDISNYHQYSKFFERRK